MTYEKPDMLIYEMHMQSIVTLSGGDLGDGDSTDLTSLTNPNADISN